MDDTWRRCSGRLARFLALSAAITASGCGGGPKTGDLMEDVPGQEAGEQASMDEMERLMKEGMVK
ncbi:hypothetical protein [Tautonia rosea]|uniref:hypothetical protein n=1 Tax=Tautonia rosea TaxID=2728037 RepID=UPI001473AA34|nr:hypothetical protein [Tautonia rosea]